MPERPRRRIAIRTPEDLAKAGIIREDEVPVLKEVAEHFSMSLTEEVLNNIPGDDIDDPIFKQYVPSPSELSIADDESADPIGDDVHEKVKGIIHRYPDRVLLKPISVCAVYCRFCFRREKV